MFDKLISSRTEISSADTTRKRDREVRVRKDDADDPDYWRS